jgi:chromosome segregation ATPase
MQTKNEAGGAKTDTLPPWPSEPPASTGAAELDGRTTALVLSVDPRMAALEERVEILQRERAADAEQLAKMTADLSKLDDLSRAEKALRESSLVQIRRLAVLEREAEGAKTALAGATAERDGLRARTQALEDEVAVLRDALGAAEAGARAAATALESVTQALEVAVVRPKS